MFSSSPTSTKIKIENPEEPPTTALRCLLNGPFKDLHFGVSEHRLTPVHDVVFLDEPDNSTVTPLKYRPKRSTSLPRMDDDKSADKATVYYFESDE